MSEDIVPEEQPARTSNNAESPRSSEETSLAQNGAGTLASYQSIDNTGNVNTEHARSVLSGIKPSLSYFETIGICLLTLIVPLLLDPVTGSKPTISMDHFLVQSLSIILACIISAFVCGLFAEMHHYHYSCGGIASVANSVLGSGLYYFAIAGSMAAVVSQVSDSVVRLADLIDRQAQYTFAASSHDFSVKLGIVTLLLVLVIFLSSLLGVLAISRLGAVLAVLSFCFTFVIGVFGIIHQKYGDFGEYMLIFNKLVGNVRSTELNDNPSTPYVDAGLHSYIKYLIGAISQLMVINLLLPLTEDNKLKKHKINIIGACVFAAVVIASLFMNLTLSHIKSDQDVFIDQAGLTMGMPSQLVLTISVIVGLSTLCRGIIIMYSLARVFCHMVVTQEEAGRRFRFRVIKILKMPMFVNGIQCIIVAFTLFIRKEDIKQFALVSLFIYICIGAICHILHRYSSPESCVRTPLIESMGSWQPLKAIKVLLVLVILTALALCIADIAGDYIAMPSYTSKQIYALVRGMIALLFIGAVSIIASFDQKHGIAGIYRWLLWTPLIPSCAVMLACVAVVYSWFWGAIIFAVILLLTANIAVIDTIMVKFCCRAPSETPDDIAQE